MGDADDGCPLLLAQAPEEQGHLLLSFGVELAGRLIEQDDRAFAQQALREHHPLALPAGEQHARFAGRLFEPALDLPGNTGEPGGLGDFFVVLTDQAQVVFDRAFYQEGLLRQVGDVGAQLRQADFRERAAVYRDFPLLHFIKAQQQLEDRALARAARAGYPCPAALRENHRPAGEHLPAGARIAKAYLPQRDLLFKGPSAAGIFGALIRHLQVFGDCRALALGFFIGVIGFKEIREDGVYFRGVAERGGQQAQRYLSA